MDSQWIKVTEIVGNFVNVYKNKIGGDYVVF